ncbi:MAG: ComF family protein [Bacteroidetes bacterium]|jgi:ComF family protein|nr:ComF family protein [Bacteroidota bacterium]
MLFQGALDLLFPKVCMSCEAQLHTGEELLCTSCRFDIPECNWTNPGDNLITDKLLGRVPLVYADALLYFEKRNKTQKLIHELKYKNQEHISKYLGLWHAEKLKRNAWTSTIDAIIPVPIHAKRKRERGYNQVEGYTKALCQKLNCEYNDKLLYRKHYSRTQVFKNRLARTGVIEHNFILNPKAVKSNYKHLALADDLITTGATAEACFIQLSKLKHIKLSLLVMAVAA